MADNNNNSHYLKVPPEQTVPGIVLFHEDPDLDERIRQVAILKESGYDIDTICKTVERRPTQVKAYFRQIRLAQLKYIAAFPEEFDSGLVGLHKAILDRRDFGDLLRREYQSHGNSGNASNKVGILKLIMRNMRELEELTGLTIQRVQHSGTVNVKDEMRLLLDGAPEELREAYLDALSALVHAAEGRTAPPPDAE